MYVVSTVDWQSSAIVAHLGYLCQMQVLLVTKDTAASCCCSVTPCALVANEAYTNIGYEEQHIHHA